jgi:hypothetical protein
VAAHQAAIPAKPEPVVDGVQKRIAIAAACCQFVNEFGNPERSTFSCCPMLFADSCRHKAGPHGAINAERPLTFEHVA